MFIICISRFWSFIFMDCVFVMGSGVIFCFVSFVVLVKFIDLCISVNSPCAGVGESSRREV